MYDIVNVNDDLLGRLEVAPVVPLVVPDDPETAIKTTRALVEGGLSVIEVVLRTSAAVECLGEVVKAVPEAIVGAGTVLSERQAKNSRMRCVWDSPKIKQTVYKISGGGQSNSDQTKSDSDLEVSPTRDSQNGGPSPTESDQVRVSPTASSILLGTTFHFPVFFFSECRAVGDAPADVADPGRVCRA